MLRLPGSPNAEVTNKEKEAKGKKQAQQGEVDEVVEREEEEQLQPCIYCVASSCGRTGKAKSPARHKSCVERWSIPASSESRVTVGSRWLPSAKVKVVQ